MTAEPRSSNSRKSTFQLLGPIRTPPPFFPLLWVSLKIQSPLGFRGRQKLHPRSYTVHPGICSLWLLPPDYEFHLAVGGRLLGIISKREVWRWRASTRLCLLEKVRRSPPLGPHVYSIELNYCYLVERKRLGLGVQFWTSSSDVGLWASRRRAALWELKSPGRCLALRRRSEGQAGTLHLHNL